MNDREKTFMLQAIKLSQQGMDLDEGGPFGCVIVFNDQIIGRGNNKVTSTNDPTAHAEITAIRDACRALNSFQLGECEIYSSCEPCPMCLGAIYWAKIKKIYYACTREDAKGIGFSDDFIYNEIPKPLDQRAIPAEQIIHHEGMNVFRKWMIKPNRIIY